MAAKKLKSTGTRIQLVFEHLDRLLVSGAVMAGGAAVANFKMLLTPSYPEVSTVAALIITFSGLGLAVWVVTDGIIHIGEVYRSKIKTLIYGGLYVFLGVTMAVALFFVTATAINK